MRKLLVFSPSAPLLTMNAAVNALLAALQDTVALTRLLTGREIAPNL